MTARNCIASFAMGAVMFSVLTAFTMRGQQIDPPDDPNFPWQVSLVGLRVQWTRYPHGLPAVWIVDPQALPATNYGFERAEYIGWNEQGSWLVAENGKIYVWNVKDNSLTNPYNDYKQIPQNIVDSLRNIASKSVITDDRYDPNVPGPMSPPGLIIQWSQPQPGYPSVILADPNPNGPRSSHPPQYLGWNDQGSYFRNDDDHQVYVWNLKKNSLTKIGPEVPPETLATLRNNHYAVAKNTTPSPPKAQAPEPQTPDTSRQKALFGDVGKLPQATPPGAIAGTATTIQGGVLTFTRADNTKATYKVVRPKVMQNNPQGPAAGITGTWIAMEDGGKGIIFTVLTDGTLTGREVPAQIIQMLTQTPAQH
jgi:hypothetical protein